MQARFTLGLAIFALVAFSSVGLGATMTFNGLGNQSSYAENGILATSDPNYPMWNLGLGAHLDDGGTGQAYQIDFTMAGRFNAQGFDLIPSSSNYLTISDFYDENGNVTNTTYVETGFDNVEVSGYRNGLQVALARFDMFSVQGRFRFGSVFRNIDRLTIGFAPPPFQGVLVDTPQEFSYAACTDSPCTHFNIRDVTLTPVPLAPGGLLLSGALGLVALRRRLG